MSKSQPPPLCSPEVRTHRVLVIGICLADQKNNAGRIVSRFARSSAWAVEQRWAVIGEARPPSEVEAVTAIRLNEMVPKFILLNRLLSQVEIGRYDFVVVCDDDISFADDFLDRYLDCLLRYDLALAQPARTHDSYIDHHFVERLDGLTARLTLFVEIGPLFTVRRDLYETIFPFEEDSPMGWGYDLVWPHRINEKGLRMGIVDAAPVEHSMRRPVKNYDYDEADSAMSTYLSVRPHVRRDDAMRIVEAYAESGGGTDEMRSSPSRLAGVNAHAEASPMLSVIICTYNRAEMLNRALESLAAQTLDRAEYEIVVIDDGSSDSTRDVAARYGDALPVRYSHQENAGLASAKNHGIYVSRGEILLFLDDDDIAAPTLLHEHLMSHRRYSAENYAVLTNTIWAPELSVTPVMRFITDVGCFLFSYPHIKHGDILDFTYFWGGRSSCKRAFLIERGVFNPVFRFGCEDIELGYRLAQYGLKVVYNGKGVSMMARPVTFDDFCRRLVKQGRSQYVFNSLHDDSVVREWTEVRAFEDMWDKVEPVYTTLMRSARALDMIAGAKRRSGLELDRGTELLLYRAYWRAFKACKLKGIAEAAAGHRQRTV